MCDGECLEEEEEPRDTALERVLERSIVTQLERCLETRDRVPLSSCETKNERAVYVGGRPWRTGRATTRDSGFLTRAESVETPFKMHMRAPIQASERETPEQTLETVTCPTRSQHGESGTRPRSLSLSLSLSNART